MDMDRNENAFLSPSPKCAHMDPHEEPLPPMGSTPTVHPS